MDFQILTEYSGFSYILILTLKTPYMLHTRQYI